MADPTAKFSFSIEADTSGADKATESLEALQQGIAADVGALRQMQRALSNLKGSSQIAEGSLKSLRDKIDAQKTAIALSQKKFIDLGGTFKGIKPPTAGFAAMLAEARAMPGPIGKVAGALAGQSKWLTASRVGMLAVAAGTVVAVAAIGAAVKALGAYGVANANARRDELLRLEGLTKIRNFWGVAGGSASFLQDQIDAVSDSVALGRDQIAGYATQLHKMGLRGEALKTTLEGMSIAGATQGEEMAQRFAGMAAGAAATGQSVKRLADDVKARLGGIAKAQLLSLGTQATKLKENFGKLFAGLKIEGLLGGIKMVADLFSQSNEAGKALKTILGLVFQPLSDGVAKVAPTIRSFFEGVTIGVLDILILFYKVRNAVRDAFGGSAKKGVDDMSTSLNLGKAAAYAFAAGLALLVPAIAILSAGAIVLATKAVIAMGVALWGAAAGAIALAAPFAAAAAAGLALGIAAKQAYLLWKEVDWSSLGSAIVEGIVSGIYNGIDKVFDAVGDVASKVKNKFKSIFGISSPSKVFAGFGGNLTQGLSAGLDRGRPQVVTSTRKLATAALGSGEEILNERQGFKFDASDLIGGKGEPETATTPKASGNFAPRNAAPAPAAQSSAPAITISKLEVHAKSDNPQDLALAVKDALEQILAGVAVQVGA